MVEKQKLKTGKLLSVIVRLHKFDDYTLLKECLLSLLKCDSSSIIRVILVCQNYEGDEFELRDIIDFEGFEIKYVFVKGSGDVRSLLIKRGFEEADTKYVTLLDYDDVTSTHGYTNAIEALENNPSKGAVFGSIIKYEAVLKGGEREIKREIQNFYTSNLWNYCIWNQFPVHACVINTEIIRDLPSMVNTDLVACEDYWIFLKIVSYYDCYVLPKKQLMGYYYHYLNVNLNTENTAFTENEMLIAIDELRLETFHVLLKRYGITFENWGNWFLGVRKLSKTFLWKELSLFQRFYFYLGYLIQKAALLWKKKG